MTDTTFNFYVFGTPRLQIDDSTVTLPPQPAAFCSFLVLNRQRRVTREEVQAAFWPDAAPARAQERLRRTLYLLRKALDPHTHLVTAEGAELAIAPDARLWIDYEAFENTLLDAYRDDPPDRALLEQAVALYKDDLLKDIYADWVLLEREHARQQFVTALRHLLQVCQHDNDWRSVIRYAHVLLELDPFQEVAHRALMTAYAATDDRSAALRQYQHCVRILDEELGADPLPETTRLYEDIRQGKGVVAAIPAAPVAIATPTATDLNFVPLVGREREIAEIMREWRICQAGHSRLLLVTGPAGMGKTRLVEEATQHIPGPAVQVITGHCYAMEAGTPYQLIADLMRNALDHVTDDQLDPALRAELAQLVPALLHNGNGNQLGQASSPPDTTLRLQEAVTQVIRLMAASGDGLWLVTEDLHWADPASLACLNHALRRCHGLPLMVLATLRDEEVSYDSPIMDWPTSSVHAPAPTTLIALPPLLPDQLQMLLVALTGDDARELNSFLQVETAGNPFFVVETLRALIEQNVLVNELSGKWQVRGSVPEPTGLPMSDVVLSVIQGRIRRLTRAAQEVLTVAAVIEHDIDEKLLAKMVDPALALDLALDEILQASILAEAQPGVYQFTHIKVREIIYADTSAPRRRFLHRRIAETLAQSSSERLAHISRLAYHYAQAREWTPALLHGWRAAQTALNTGALAEANRYATNAQHILDEYGSELNVADLPESLAALRFDLLTLRAEFSRRAATAGLYYPPDLLDAIETLLPGVDDSRRAQAHLQRATHLLGQGDLVAAKDAAAQGRELYAQQHDRWGELNALEHQIGITYRAGDMVTMRALLDDMRALGQALDADNVTQILTANEMRLATYQGDWMHVLHLAQALLSPHQMRFDPAIAWLSLANLGLAYMKLGAYEEAYTVAQQAVAASEDAHVLGLGARVLLARLELVQGQGDQARDRLLAILERPDPLIGQSEVVSPALALVRCYVAAGDDETAKYWSKHASAAMSRIRLPILFPLSQIAWTLTYLAAERYEDARKRLVYPLELMLLLEDTSPQEVLVLRAAAARGLGDEAAVQHWLAQARDLVQQQAAAITDPLYRDSFLTQVALHRFITTAAYEVDWQPADVLQFSD